MQHASDRAKLSIHTTDVSSVKYLNYYLQLYNSKMRSLLLHGNDHDLFFVAPRGNPFSHASYNNYISGLFEKYLSRRLTTVDLRKIVVDYFLSPPESSDYSLRESFPTVVYCTGKRTSRKLAEKEVFCRHPEMLSEIVVFGSWQPC